MGVPAESFVICFEAGVSPHSISFSYTLFDGLRFSFGMTAGSGSSHINRPQP